MNTLEERLRAELRAESHLVTPDSIPALRLPGHGGPRLASRPAGQPRTRPGWMAPLAAAAAVAAVIAGTLTVAHLVSGGGSQGPAAAPAAYSHLPPYYASTVQGNIVSYAPKGTQEVVTVPGRHIQIRATATGRLVATVSPPRPYNDFMLLTGSADGRTFVFGADRYRGFHVTTSPFTGALDRAAPVRFVMVRVTRGGRVRISAVSLPFTVLPGQQPSIALSPDGTRLAVAYGGGGRAAVVRVVTLASGAVRQWQWPHVSWTPLLGGQGAWTAGNRTLVLQQWYVTRGANGSAPKRDTPAGTTPVWLIDTAAQGAAGHAARRFLLLRSPAGLPDCGHPFITPGGHDLVMACATSSGRPPSGPARGEFAVYSARTAAATLVRTGGAWTWPAAVAGRPGPGGLPYPFPEVAWSDPSGTRVLVLQPRGGINRLGVLAGGKVRLAGGGLLPPHPAGYAALQGALLHAFAIPPHMTW